MPVGPNIQAWRLSRGQSVEPLAAKTGVPPSSLDAIESGELDPTVSTLETLGAALGIPPAWLHSDPQHLDLLTSDLDGDASEPLPTESGDPVMELVLLGTRQERGLYVLLTALLQSGDPELLRAVEVNLQRLVKQSKQTTIPWQTRPPGHFEPPSD